MLTLYKKIINKLDLAKDLPPLFFRLILAYGFYGPATMKLGNIDGIIEWFSGMGMPFPTLNAYLATTTEVAGFVLLFLGLGVRLISLPLIFVMMVAIFTVHIGNGFEAGENGFEIPIYYLLMLFSLVITGPGRFSMDALIKETIRRRTS
jgi:putative oxidoreductase